MSVCQWGPCKYVAIVVQEGIDPSFEVIFVGSLPVDVKPETQDVRSASMTMANHPEITGVSYMSMFCQACQLSVRPGHSPAQLLPSTDVLTSFCPPNTTA